MKTSIAEHSPQGRFVSAALGRIRSYAAQVPIRGRLQVDRLTRRDWPHPRPLGKDARVGVCFVSYNTKDLSAQLLFSLFRIIGRQQLAAVVVVDNASTDGSVELLREFSRAELIDLVENQEQRYHGPGLNQAIDRLTELRELGAQFDYIWVLDSDALVLREDAYRVARDVMVERSAAMLGQFQFSETPAGYAHPSSLLLDPSKSWRWPTVPFEHSGSPARQLHRSLRAQRQTIVDFPYRRDHFILHLGRGTVKEVVLSGETTNRHYEQAKKHHRTCFHYHGNPDGELIYGRFLDAFRAETGDGSPQNILRACERGERIEFDLPRAVAEVPREEKVMKRPIIERVIHRVSHEMRLLKGKAKRQHFPHAIYEPTLSRALGRAIRAPAAIRDHLSELFNLAVLAQPKLIVELGTRGGDSTRALLAAAELCDATVLSVDINPSGRLDVEPALRDRWNFVQSDDIVFGREHFAGWCKERGLTPKAELIFIDSSHLYEHTKEEIAVWMDFLTDDGFMVFHDTNMGSVYFRLDNSIGLGWDNDRGVIRAIEDFLGRSYDENAFFTDVARGFLIWHRPNSSGLTVMKKLPTRPSDG